MTVTLPLPGDGWEAAQRALQYGSDSDSAEGEGEGDRTVEGPLEPPLSSDDCLSGMSDDDEAALRHAGVFTDDEVRHGGGWWGDTPRVVTYGKCGCQVKIHMVRCEAVQLL